MKDRVKVLITGGAGFIGYHLANKLSNYPNYQIVIVDSFKRGRMDDELIKLQQKENVLVLNGDLTSDQFYESLGLDFDYIYHLAAIIGVRNVTNHPDQVLGINALSILKLFEHFKESKHIKKVFFSSTSEIYAGTLHHFEMSIPTPENTPLTLLDIESSRTTYMLSKMFGESVCFNYSKKYGIPCAIGRYHNVYGPRMGFQHVIPEMIVKINKSTNLGVASSNHTRAYCYIDDAIDMTILLTEKTKPGCDVYNIGVQGPEIKVLDLVKLIAKTMKKEIIIAEKEDIAGSPNRRCPDMRKLNDCIVFQPNFTLDTGLRITYDWYKKHLDNVYE